MFIIEYDTWYCKDILWIAVCAFSSEGALSKLHSLIDDVSYVRSIVKQY